MVTAGAWLGHLLSDLGFPLRPERNVVHWLRPAQRPEQFEPGAFPIFIWDTGAGQTFYGLPHLERPGVKVGLHHSGEWCDPDTVSREARPQDAPVLAFTARAIPDLVGAPESSVVCLYTNTSGRALRGRPPPRTPALVFAGGTSGHGFKFCTVLGEVLADLATTGAATPAAGFLGLSRLTERAESSPPSRRAPPPGGSASAPGGASAWPPAGWRSGARVSRGPAGDDEAPMGDVPQVHHLAVDGEADDREARLVAVDVRGGLHGVAVAPDAHRRRIESRRLLRERAPRGAGPPWRGARGSGPAPGGRVWPLPGHGRAPGLRQAGRRTPSQGRLSGWSPPPGRTRRCPSSG